MEPGIDWEAMATRAVGRILATGGLGRLYAGIGKTDLEPGEETLLSGIARHLSGLGWILRSGGALGSDALFAAGAGQRKEIFTPALATIEGLELAPGYHPNWAAVKKKRAEAFHARNVNIILGECPISAPRPVEFVLCLPDREHAWGGTGQGIRVALALGIPVVNLTSLSIRVSFLSGLKVPGFQDLRGARQLTLF